MSNDTHRWLRYLSHPEVAIDPAVAVPDWSLHPDGRARLVAFLARRPAWLDEVEVILTSPERKAVETAELVGAAIGRGPRVVPGSGEVDRASTGFVAAERHERLADRLFAEPTRSADGWERAVDARDRVIAALSPHLAGRTLVVGHGGVGTLWWCTLVGVAIDRRHDQPGQGHVWCRHLDDPSAGHGWRRLEAV